MNTTKTLSRESVARILSELADSLDSPHLDHRAPLPIVALNLRNLAADVDKIR